MEAACWRERWQSICRARAPTYDQLHCMCMCGERRIRTAVCRVLYVCWRCRACVRMWCMDDLDGGVVRGRQLLRALSVCDV